ncbi:MAG: HTTM domain-containing protein [Deltaproteobacteria bacterium]|nr:HTTM domain-containing protein [Deltaproteobacteria bacterium]
MPTAIETWWAGRHRAVSAASLALFERTLGLVLWVAVVRFFAHDWIHQLYVVPKLHFHYYGFGFVQPWPEPWLSLWFLALGALGLLLASGYNHRGIIALALLAFGYVELLDAINYLNHYYFLSCALFLMLLVPRPRLGGQVPAWSLWAFRLMVGLVYFYAGLAKLEPDWLLRGEPLASWLHGRRELGAIGGVLERRDVARLMAWAGLALDLSIPLWLSLRRTRSYAFVVVILFHGITGWLFPIGVFPWVMTLAATLFFAPDWPRCWAARWLPWPVESTLPFPAARWRGALVVVFLVLQVGLPLRHLLYPGPVVWGEEGFRFSWRVMLVEKHGVVRYQVTVPAEGRTYEVYPESYLTPLQLQQLGGQPELILQLAHHVAREFRAAGHLDPEVRAEAWLSLNGQPLARLIDPLVDLAQVEDGLGPKRWILSPQEEPPSTRAGP